jgi:hypothetical protein
MLYPLSRNAFHILKPGGKRSFGRPGYKWEDLTLIFKKQDMRVWTGLSWLRIGLSSGIL